MFRLSVVGKVNSCSSLLTCQLLLMVFNLFAVHAAAAVQPTSALSCCHTCVPQTQKKQPSCMLNFQKPHVVPLSGLRIQTCPVWLQVRLEHMLQRLRSLQDAAATSRPTQLLPCELYVSGPFEAACFGVSPGFT